MRHCVLSIAATATLLFWACASPDAGGDTDSGTVAVAVEYEKYELDNGLDVILHVDRSDPAVAVAMTFHVGSSREVPGRTGFAHLFEHLFFLDSENLGYGGLDRLMTRIGSSTNGSTNRDRTNYFEVVPKDGLEKALWAEADKLGYFINTVTESVVAKEKQVVKNEKRQGVDNQPYGHSNYVIDQALYPEGHPYRWQVIGSLEDLDNASLADVKAFHNRWYGPNNATLVVAGDIDVDQTRAWIEKYFGEIPARPTPESGAPPEIALTESRLLVHEDNFARLPQLTMAWPTVRLYHPDSYALDILADVLTDGKRSPFYEVIVEEQELAPAVFAGNGSQELAGRFTLQVRAYANTDLDVVRAAIDSAFTRFERNGVAQEELSRIKAGYETQFYGSLSSVIGKAFQLAQYNIFAPSPGYLTEDLERLLAVTDADVMRVYEEYIKDRPFVAASFVPRGEPALALEGSRVATVVEEPIVPGEGEFVLAERGAIERTESSFDRTVEPPFGEPPTLTAPAISRQTLDNGVRVLVIEDHEIPLVQFELRMKAGLLLDDPARVGVANLLAETMTEGTANRTPEELEQAIDLLGASINVSSGRESFVISGSTLARNFPATMELVEEILLEPRWDPEQFELARQRVANTLRQRSASPTALASDAFARLVYGDHILARNPLGDTETIDALTIEDLQTYYENALVPDHASFLVAGAVGLDDVTRSLLGIAQRWETGEVDFPEPPVWSPDRAGLYFLDVPGSSQSVLQIGYLALPETDAEYYPATVMNYRLGGGGFASDLTQVLREQKGYTYGIGSRFAGSDIPGPFSISSSVRSNVTFESLDLIKNLVERHGPDFDETDLEATRGFLTRSNARAFETLGAKLGILRDVADYGFPADYVLQRETIVRNMTIDRIRELADRFLDPEAMVWLVVGDAATQRDRLADLDLGTPVPIDRNGQPIR
jgi:zinc protease